MSSQASTIARSCASASSIARTAPKKLSRPLCWSSSLAAVSASGSPAPSTRANGREPALDLLVTLECRERTSETLGELRPDHFRLIRFADVALGADHLHQRPVDDAGSERRAPSATNTYRRLAFSEPVLELVEQTRLAHTGLPDHRDHVGRRVPLHPFEGALQLRKLLIPPDERGRRGAPRLRPARLPDLERLPRRHRLGLPLHPQRRQLAI